MKFVSSQCSLVLATSTLVAATVQASIAPASHCSLSDVSGTGITVTSCSGYHVGNLNNAADFADVKVLLEGQFSGLVLGSQRLEQIDIDSSSAALATRLHGDTVIGIHWGGGAGGGNTAFYRFDVDAGYTGAVDIVTLNPARGRGGVSNVALYSTAQAITAPNTTMPVITAPIAADLVDTAPITTAPNLTAPVAAITIAPVATATISEPRTHILVLAGMAALGLIAQRRRAR